MPALLPADGPALPVQLVRAMCRRHTGLTAAALAELAPVAAAGHTAHLLLHIAEHAPDWAAGRGTPPQFITRSRALAGVGWDQAAAQVALPGEAERLAAYRRVGEIATTHLVGLAEAMIRHIIRQMRLRQSAQTAVLDVEDMLATGRAAVAQGIWAYDPARPSGAHYLRTWIEEHVKRDLAGAAYQVSLPTRVRARFLRIAGVRASLADRLGREPTDAELLARPDAGFTQRDLDEERQTRPRRGRTGLGLQAASHNNGALYSGVELSEVRRVRPATYDPTDPQNDVIEDRVLQHHDEHNGPATSGWRAALEVLQLGRIQREIVARSLGLAPFENLPQTERTERMVAAAVGLKRSTVHDVLSALRTEMNRPGGRLHHLLAMLSTEDREGLGLQSFQQLLGPLEDANPPGPAPVILTKALPHNLPSPVPSDAIRRRGLLVRYECTRRRCGWAGYEHSLHRRFTLRRIRCPDCGNTAHACQHRRVGEGVG
ncbi:hypothetical protein JOF53_006556 [Crossiella equi]|uniref:Uncharacterized protein n=1 Tax=Crossiella equi TaxID=130796 RepID=A0ABS5ANB2_9PSEU|nr:hypothetical protein [Crossiella equi]MBP2477684.1 hypothetical protein [Crossiella equi]